MQLPAQYYFAGTTIAEGNGNLSFVKMRLRSTGLLYQSGSSGGFGIPSHTKTDSVTCFAPGYDTLNTLLVSGSGNTLVLKPNTSKAEQEARRNNLSSLTHSLPIAPDNIRYSQGESYNETQENGFVNTSSYPSIGFSPNTSHASYSNIRRFLNNQSFPPPDAVRQEEMLNYFSLSCAPLPASGETFGTSSCLSSCPWNKKNLLLFLTAQAARLDLTEVAPANLVFLIDNSGSMDMPNRLPLLKEAFKMLVKNLRDTDRVAIVTYGGAAGIALPPTGGADKEKIIQAINAIVPGGATPGSNGIRLAYDLANANLIAKGNNRVILATDGDFNIGITDEKELERMIERYRSWGIHLTCLGVGMGNYKNSKIEVLARHGYGNFAYLDTEIEAEKVLVKELTQNLYVVASNATVEVELNAPFIKQYRLIGYDNRKESLKDPKSILLGSEIGSGYPMVAVLELQPTDTTGEWLKISEQKNIGHFSIRYQTTTNRGLVWKEQTQFIPVNYTPFALLNSNLKLATAVTMFGSLLRHSPFAPQISFQQVNQIAQSALNPSDPLQIEFLGLTETAKKLYEADLKKKNKGLLK